MPPSATIAPAPALTKFQQELARLLADLIVAEYFRVHPERRPGVTPGKSTAPRALEATRDTDDGATA
jgi:hypothetical protein